MSHSSRCRALICCLYCSADVRTSGKMREPDLARWHMIARYSLDTVCTNANQECWGCTQTALLSETKSGNRMAGCSMGPSNLNKWLCDLPYDAPGVLRIYKWITRSPKFILNFESRKLLLTRACESNFEYRKTLCGYTWFINFLSGEPISCTGLSRAFMGKKYGTRPRGPCQ